MNVDEEDYEVEAILAHRFCAVSLEPLLLRSLLAQRILMNGLTGNESDRVPSQMAGVR